MPGGYRRSLLPDRMHIYKKMTGLPIPKTRLRRVRSELPRIPKWKSRLRSNVKDTTLDGGFSPILSLRGSYGNAEIFVRSDPVSNLISHPTLESLSKVASQSKRRRQWQKELSSKLAMPYIGGHYGFFATMGSVS
jgi:hypothetical protein